MTTVHVWTCHHLSRKRLPRDPSDIVLSPAAMGNRRVLSAEKTLHRLTAAIKVRPEKSLEEARTPNLPGFQTHTLRCKHIREERQQRTGLSMRPSLVRISIQAGDRQQPISQVDRCRGIVLRWPCASYAAIRIIPGGQKKPR